MEEKTINIFCLNHIKELSRKIFEELDSDCPRHCVVADLERARDIWIEQHAGIKNPVWKKELRNYIRWEVDDCASVLESKGWVVTHDKERKF